MLFLSKGLSNVNNQLLELLFFIGGKEDSLLLLSLCPRAGRGVTCRPAEVGNPPTQHLMNVDVVSGFKWMDKLEPNVDNPMIQGLSLFCQAKVFA